MAVPLSDLSSVRLIVVNDSRFTIIIQGRRLKKSIPRVVRHHCLLLTDGSDASLAVEDVGILSELEPRSGERVGTSIV